jgi:ferredoxin-NADP reductase
MAMLRHRRASASPARAHLLYSARTAEDLLYFGELEDLRRAGGDLKVFFTLTRAQPPGWTGYARRVDRQMLQEVAEPLGQTVQAFVCGPTLFVETVASNLLEIGASAERVRTERFGPTGGSS